MGIAKQLADAKKLMADKTVPTKRRIVAVTTASGTRIVVVKGH